MGLKEEQQSLRDQLEEALKAENPEAIEVQDESVEEESTEQEPESEVEEPKKEDPPKEEKKEEAQDDSAFARMRREKAAEKKMREDAERRANELEERLKRLERGETATQEQFQQPVYQDPEIEQIKYERTFQKATQEFVRYENEAQAGLPDYLGMATAYKVAVYNGLKLDNPEMTHEELLDKTTKKVILQAAHDTANGKDPAISLYDRAKLAGLTPYKAEEPPEDTSKEEPKRPNLDAVARNRLKNAGTAAAKGSNARGELTREHAGTQMTNAEWMKLTVAERQRLMYGN